MLVTTDWLSGHSSHGDLVLLHVGTDRGIYDAGHIPGARFVDWAAVTTTRNGVPNQVPAVAELQAALEKLGIGDDSHVIIYGDTPLLASVVYFELDYLGHAKTAMLDGMLEAWKAEKRPLSKDQPQFKPAALTVTPHPELMVDMAAVEKIAAEKKIVVLDGRAPDQYSGKNPGDGIKRGGHIPGAKNVFWMQTLVSKENPTLKPVEQIRALYQATGLKPGDPVVVYCRTGPIATHEYFTLKLAGFRPQLYNGSFMEWSNAGTTPVESGI
jgi:thiosulfate/3-mercaptopyruvate sulfurtransferase